ncbi:MAG: hypothetical protein AAGL08_12110 [Cyanobacteria bacterium J06573_11]
MYTYTPSGELGLSADSHISTITLEEAVTELPVPTVDIVPEIASGIAHQITFGCIAIGAIVSVSGLLKQFRLLIKALDSKEDR